MSTTSSTPMIESKTARKRKAKAGTVTATTPPSSDSVEAKINGTVDEESSSDSHYVKELAKQIRNIHKKLAAVQKTETVITEFPDTSLDDLIAQKKINADQKAQVLKKPQLETQLKQYEEQHKQLKEFAQDLEARHEKDKTTLTDTHKAELAQVKEDALEQATKNTTAKVHDALQVVCQFLHAAAYKRQQEDVDERESKAYEGVLFYLYQGNSTAIDAMTSLVEGTEEKTKDPTGDEIEYTFAQLKASAEAAANIDAAEPQDTTESTPAVEESAGTDPTIANAGMTELEDTTTIPVHTSEDVSADADMPSAAPDQTSTTAEAANAVAETSWNPEASITTDNTQPGEDWVQVPRDPAETETPHAPAMQQSTSNWADEAGAAAEEKDTAATSANDGFSEVRRERGGRGRGGNRGGRGSDGRGRGRGRGDFKGRGRGGRGGPRGGAQAQSG